MCTEEINPLLSVLLGDGSPSPMDYSIVLLGPGSTKGKVTLTPELAMLGHTNERNICRTQTL